MNLAIIVRKLMPLSLLILFMACIAGCGGSNSESTQEVPTKLLGGSMQGKGLTLIGTESTVAGLPSTPSAALLSYSFGIATDGTNLYVADTGNNAIRKVVIATGAVTTLAGGTSVGSSDGVGTAASFDYPMGITTDGVSLYVTDTASSTIRKVKIATGEVTTVAGSPGVTGSTDGVASAARFFSPWGITCDGTNLYVADSGNKTIRKIVIATGEVTTLAGSAGNDGSTDGTGVLASFRSPAGITTDGTSLYVTDGHSSIRKVDILTGAVTTTAANSFFNAIGIATDGTSLFVSDSPNNIICKVDIATGVVTTLAGSVITPKGSTDGIGDAAKLAFPTGIAIHGTNLYVADADNYSIRKISTATGAVTTILGSARAIGSSDGIASAARLNAPRGITTDGANLYVADTDNCTIRKIVIATGVVTTLAGSADNPRGSSDGIGASAQFNLPTGVTTDGTNLLVADTLNNTIRKIDVATGAVNTLAGSGVAGSTDGTGSTATFSRPYGVTTDGMNLYVTDIRTDSIRKVVIETGEVSTLVSGGSQVSEKGITTDGTNLYVADSLSKKVRKVVIATGEVSTLAGSDRHIGLVDGTGSAAGFNNPSGITTDGANLYITDGSAIRKIVIATGAVTTIRNLDYGWLFGITTDGTQLYAVDLIRNTVVTIR